MQDPFPPFLPHYLSEAPLGPYESCRQVLTVMKENHEYLRENVSVVCLHSCNRREFVMFACIPAIGADSSCLFAFLQLERIRRFCLHSCNWRGFDVFACIPAIGGNSSCLLAFLQSARIRHVCLHSCNRRGFVMFVYIPVIYTNPRFLTTFTLAAEVWPQKGI